MLFLNTNEQNAFNKEPLANFKLRPPKTARISEIGEATATSAITAADRVNFHIGHPIQAARLTALYGRLVLVSIFDPSCSLTLPIKS